MKFPVVSRLALLVGAAIASAEDDKVHGQGALGKDMGPVGFLWPKGRPWSASAVNTAPCGSQSGVGNRTMFPISQGSVALSIADEAWDVAFSVAYDDDPLAQSDFTQKVAGDVAAVEPGHQCYKIAAVPPTVTAGSNATIQLEYRSQWSGQGDELPGRKQSFYACADITFVEVQDFAVQVPCFNVTSSDFKLPDPSSSTTPVTPTGHGEDTTEAAVPSSGVSGGLSTGAKAGIAVGVVVASLMVVGAIAFVLLRKRKRVPTDHEGLGHNVKTMPETSSVNSRY